MENRNCRRHAPINSNQLGERDGTNPGCGCRRSNGANNRGNDILADTLADTYNQGYREGYNDGYNDGRDGGYIEGYNQGYRQGVKAANVMARQAILNAAGRRRGCCFRRTFF